MRAAPSHSTRLATSDQPRSRARRGSRRRTWHAARNGDLDRIGLILLDDDSSPPCYLLLLWSKRLARCVSARFMSDDLAYDMSHDMDDRRHRGRERRFVCLW